MEENTLDQDFPLVGIGASAGGLSAVKTFFDNMSSDKNISFVLIQHKSGAYKSSMGSILEKYTSMTIDQIQNGTKAEPNHIYLNPPDKHVEINDGEFHLLDTGKYDTSNLPIDHFLRSLAKEKKEKAICIILSGTGSDGSLGLREVKGSGGMTMVQEEKQAEYSGMPHSAIDTGLVDHVLAAEEMPQKLLNYLQHPYTYKSTGTKVEETQFKNNLSQIFSILHKETGVDFSNYKKDTVQRRISRRMAIQQINDTSAYLEYLKSSEDEVAALFHDLLIKVTSFFRDPEAFDSLQKNAIPDLLKSSSPNSPLRLWVPGCATGEEAYSLAILIMEIMEERNDYTNAQIFATDLVSSAVEFARQGTYPESISGDLSPERLDRFFIKEGDRYRVRDQLREMVVFAEHNFLSDPPFSNLDLISCRNVLIYLNRELREEILPMFHYALNDHGLLFLGSSENIGEFSDLYEPIDKENRIFRQKGDSQARNHDFSIFSFSSDRSTYSKPEREKTRQGPDVEEMAETSIMDNYTYPSLLVDGEYNILFFHGDTDKYLSPPEGEANFNLLDMARGNLRHELHTTLAKARDKRKTVINENVRLKYGNGYHSFDLVVEPIEEGANEREFLLVVFKDTSSVKDKMEPKKSELDEEERDQRIEMLERELESTTKSLQKTVERLKISNEELQSSNEELQATNEELRSANEELETGKEEAQSTNEELTAVNEQLQNKVEELAQANNDIKNLLSSTGVATVFLDTDLKIRRFTPPAEKIFNIRESDIGRPIEELTSTLNYEDLQKDAESVLETLEKKQKEIQDDRGRWFSVRVTPYRTTEEIVEGVVLTVIEVTHLKKEERKTRRLATVVEDSNDAITVLDMEGTITEWNRGAEKLYGYSKEQAIGMHISELLPEGQKQKTLDLIDRIKAGEKVDSLQTKRKTRNGSVLDVWLTITELVGNKGKIYAVATTERDIGKFKQMQAEYETQIDRLKQKIEKLQQ